MTIIGRALLNCEYKLQNDFYKLFDELQVIDPNQNIDSFIISNISNSFWLNQVDNAYNSINKSYVSNIFLDLYYRELIYIARMREVF